MPFGLKPICSACKSNDSPIWGKSVSGEVLCNTCSVKKPMDNASELSGENNGRGNGSVPQISQSNSSVRKSSRMKPSKYRLHSGKNVAAKGKNRRIIYKKNPIKAPRSVATVVSKDYIFYDGMYWQSGDLVSVMDHDGGIYYAQIRGFLEDQYCEKSAVINWLIPTTASPKDSFDPATYILGPSEDLPRPMELFSFVCRAPSDYYRSKAAPYPTEPHKPELAYIWTRIGPEIRRAPTQDEIFGGDVDDDDTETAKEDKRARKAVKSKLKDDATKQLKVKDDATKQLKVKDDTSKQLKVKDDATKQSKVKDDVASKQSTVKVEEKEEVPT